MSVPSNRDLRVLEIAQGLGRGGAERALTSRLAYAPNDVRTVVVNLRPELADLAVPRGIPVVSLSGHIFRKVQLLRTLVQKVAPDLVISRAPMGMIVTSAALGRGSHVSHIYESHLDVLSPMPGRSAVLAVPFAIAGKRVNGCIAVSQAVALGQQARQLHPCVVHYLGASVDLLAQPALPAVRGCRLLMLNRLVPQKRPLQVIQAVADNRELMEVTDSRLCIVGGGELLPDVRAFARQHRLDHIVEIIGEVEEPSRYLAASDILVTFGRHEGLPLTIYEAKQFGMRVIASPAGGSQEVLDAHDVRLNDFGVAGLSRAIKLMLQEPVSSHKRHEISRDAVAMWEPSVRAARYYALLRGVTRG